MKSDLMQSKAKQSNAKHIAQNVFAQMNSIKRFDSANLITGVFHLFTIHSCGNEIN